MFRHRRNIITKKPGARRRIALECSATNLHVYIFLSWHVLIIVGSPIAYVKQDGVLSISMAIAIVLGHEA